MMFSLAAISTHPNPYGFFYIYISNTYTLKMQASVHLVDVASLATGHARDWYKAVMIESSMLGSI